MLQSSSAAAGKPVNGDRQRARTMVGTHRAPPSIKMLVGDQGKEVRKISGSHHLLKQAGRQVEFACVEPGRSNMPTGLFEFLGNHVSNEIGRDRGAGAEFRFVLNPLPDLGA